MTRVVIAMMLLMSAASTRIRADIYGYTDENGVYHLSNRSSDSKKYPIVLKETRPRIKSGIASHDEIIRMIDEICSREGVDPHLAIAVAKAESSLNQNAVSPKGAIGVMQLMPDTAKRFQVKNIHSARDNIEGGVRYLKYLLGLFSDDVRLAIAAYNAGENRVIEAGGIPGIEETTRYVERVIKLYGTHGKLPPGKPIKRIVDRNGNIYLTNL